MRKALVFALTAALALVAGAAPALADPSSLPPPPPPQGSKPAKAPKAAPATAATSPPASTSEVTVAPNGALDTRWAAAAMIGLSTDYLDLGVGVRGGKTLDDHIYLGGSFLYHFAGGGSYAVAGPGMGATSVTASVIYFGPEVGYDFDAASVVIRAYVGAGPAFFSSTAAGAGVSESGSSNQFVVWPGGTVIWDVPGSAFFLAGDIRFVSVPGGPAVGFFAMGGVHFGA